MGVRQVAEKVGKMRGKKRASPNESVLSLLQKKSEYLQGIVWKKFLQIQMRHARQISFSIVVNSVERKTMIEFIRTWTFFFSFDRRGTQARMRKILFNFCEFNLYILAHTQNPPSTPHQNPLTISWRWKRRNERKLGIKGITMRIYVVIFQPSPYPNHFS